MNGVPIPARARPAAVHRRAFTVVELMVAISVLTLIVLVLFRIFDQTQRAMRGNVAQTDVMENGRLAIEALIRDLEVMEAPLERRGTNAAVTFLAAYTRTPSVQALAPPLPPPPGQVEGRTNAFEGIYFLTRSNNTWYSTVYRILETTTLLSNISGQTLEITYLVPPTNGYGSLCRLVTPLGRTNLYTNNLAYIDTQIRANNNAAYLQLFQPVADGIVHFRVTALDSAHRPVALATNLPTYPDVLRYWDAYDVNLQGQRLFPSKTNTAFFNPSLPAYLDVEVGVLEPQIIDHLLGIPPANVTARTNYFSRQAEHIQLFRQRIPIRNAPLLLP